MGPLARKAGPGREVRAFALREREARDENHQGQGKRGRPNQGTTRARHHLSPSELSLGVFPRICQGFRRAGSCGAQRPSGRLENEASSASRLAVHDHLGEVLVLELAEGYIDRNVDMAKLLPVQPLDGFAGFLGHPVA